MRGGEDGEVVLLSGSGNGFFVMGFVWVCCGFFFWLFLGFVVGVSVVRFIGVFVIGVVVSISFCNCVI